MAICLQKSQVKSTPVSANESDRGNGSESVDVQSTPSIKRVPTKRKLVEETAEVDDSKNGNFNHAFRISQTEIILTRINSFWISDTKEEPETSKIEEESTKQTSEATQVAVDPEELSSRSTRRSKNLE